eukprot:149833-Amphidinium_carterae.1
MLNLSKTWQTRSRCVPPQQDYTIGVPAAHVREKAFPSLFGLASQVHVRGTQGASFRQQMLLKLELTCWVRIATWQHGSDDIGSSPR